MKLLELEKTETHTLKPGELVYKNYNFYVGTQDLDVRVLTLQLEGKKPLKAQDFVLGLPDWVSTSLGTN